MRHIANILTTSKFDDPDLYNIVKDKKDLIDGIPTLIIGWGNASKLYNIESILDWKIDDNIYWTFGRRERGERYENDIVKFRNLVFDNIKKNIKYIFFNVLTESEEKKERFFKFLKKDNAKTVYIENDIAYITENGSNIVIGISLDDIEYEGLNKSKFLSKLYANKSINIIKNLDEFSLDIRHQIFNMPFLVPYLAQ